MQYYEVAPLAITHATMAMLTYSHPETLSSGQLVSVPVGKRVVAGVVMGVVDRPAFETKGILSVLEKTPLPEPLLKLSLWLSEYYAVHLSRVWRTMLPNGINKRRRETKNVGSPPKRDAVSFQLNPDQQNAVSVILKSPPRTHLLHGITGSGKTAVYIELAKHVVKSGRSVIVLVPEIALTSQIIADFAPYFSNVHVTHSTMTESTRHKLWQTLLNSTEPQIIIGPRSALFSPVKNLGLIIIDECHEPAFKQEQSPRYSAIRASAMLARYANAPLVLGSATPSVVDYYLAKQTNAIVNMPRLARTNAIKPEVSIVDMTKINNFTRSSFLSTSLLLATTEALANKQQVLFFHNRRGSAPTTLCESCGWSATCSRCYIPMTLHADEYRLRCHICGRIERIPTSCPDCNTTGIIHKGIGTKRVEEELRRLFPDANIARFDGDAENGVEKQYQSLYDGHIDIIVGTQVIAKGLDLPKLRLVGVVQADSGLALPDYQSSERVFQLITQVTGRVGRSEHPTKVIIQTYQPEDLSVKYGIEQDYPNFYKHCLNERHRANFPPFCHLLRLTTVYKTEKGAVNASRALINSLQTKISPTMHIFGPAPAFYERLRGSYRWQIIIKSSSRTDLVALLDAIPAKGWQIELDPISLL